VENGVYELEVEPSSAEHVGRYTVCATCSDDDSYETGSAESVRGCFVFEVVGVNHKPEWSAGWEDLELFDGETLLYNTPSFFRRRRRRHLYTNLRLRRGRALHHLRPPRSSLQTSNQSLLPRLHRPVPLPILRPRLRTASGPATRTS